MTAPQDRRGGKQLFLGSALWGWGVEAAEVFAMLDAFAETGGVVDAAANYPINKQPEDFGRAADILSEWLKSRRPDNVSVFFKLGAVNNLGGPETALSPSDILLSAELARGRFAHWLGGVAIHWDNREEADAIAASLDAMRTLAGQGLKIGFSGVRRPDLYRDAAPDLADDWWIQVKENVLTREARERYREVFPAARYIAYGVNMGGVKGLSQGDRSSLALRGLDVPPIAAELLRMVEDPPEGLEPRPASLADLATLMTWANPGLAGMIAGPRNAAQLADTLAYWRTLTEFGDAGQLWRLTESLRAGE